MAEQVAGDPADTSEEVKHGLLSKAVGAPRALIRVVRAKPLTALFVACGTSIILAAGVVSTHYLITQLRPATPPVTEQLALAQLDAGQYDAARQTAVTLSRRAGHSYAKQAGPLFVLGVAFAAEATQHWNRDDQQTLYLVAARYLEEARDRGFPAGRTAQGTFLLASCLFHAGHYAESLPVFQAALEVAPEYRYRIHRLLARAYFLDQPSQLAKAQKHADLAAKDPSLTPDQRIQLDVLRARIALAANKYDLANRFLDKIPAGSAAQATATLIRAQVRMQEADQRLAKHSASGQAKDAEVGPLYREAITLLRKAQSLDTQSSIVRQASYLTGICYHRLHDDATAEKTLARTRRTYYHTPEALAARLAEGEIQLDQGRYDAALESLLSVIGDAAEPATYENRWVSLAQLRTRLQQAHKKFLAAKQYADAVKLSAAMAPIAPDDVALLAEARAQAAWGDQLMRKAEALDPPQAAVTQAEARVHYRLAGHAYQQLAQLRLATPSYVDDLWHSGHYTLLGHNYKAALRDLRRYLDNAPREQRGRGLVALGEAQMSLGHLEQARQSLRQCIELYPKDPDTYRARLLAAQVYESLGDPKQAEKTLRENLYSVSLTPRSPQWRESLFRLGQLLYREGMKHEAKSRTQGVDSTDVKRRRAALGELSVAARLFQQAAQRLSDYVERAPTGPFATEARYYMAESWRQAAKYPRKSVLVEPTQARRVELKRQARAYLRNAADQHRILRQLLSQREQEHTLSELERRILRNTYFTYADALFDLEDYKQAIKAYSAATNRYQHKPESLEAFMQIASCYRHMNSPEQARATIMHALAVLSRIRKDAKFTNTTRYSRDQWKGLLTWLAKW